MPDAPWTRIGLTVGELIARLQQLDPALPVGRLDAETGHFFPVEKVVSRTRIRTQSFDETKTVRGVGLR